MILLNDSRRCRCPRRRGTIVALMALVVVILVAFLALAVDIGMMAVAKTQAQNAADLAALTAARTLNGNKSNTYNNAAATTNAQNIMTYNYILGQAVQPTHQLTITYGSYDYNQATQTFNANYPPTANVPYTAASTTVTTSNLPGAFSTVLGRQFLPNISASAQAVHRPRDIALVMDLSGSMRMGTCMGYDFYTSTRVSNNPDTLVPTFGHYSSASAGLIASSSTRSSAYDNYSLPGSNTTTGNTSYTQTYINSFYQSAAYASTLIRAFDSYSSSDEGKTWTAPTSQTPKLPANSTATTPGGDPYLFTSGSTTIYAKTVNDVVGSFTARPNSAPGCAQWELDGYSSCVAGSFTTTDIGQPNYSTRPFKGYTQGPGYYGKTFFVWPPDPRRANLTTAGVTWTSPNGPTSGGADTNQINQFLWDFGYTSADFNNTTAIQTTLNVSGGINSSATSLTVTLATSFPSTPFLIVVDSELMNVTAVSGSGNKTWTVTRATDGTTAASHSNGATVKLATGPPLYGIYTQITTPGGKIWENWPAGDTASGTVNGTLSYYLVNNVYIPGGTRKLQTTDAQFQKVMRLYNWKYVLDNTGTTHCDWRLRFFGTDDNTKIFNASGSLKPPGSTGMCTAIQTYNAILSWLTSTTDPFPTQLRSGRIKYYGSIPTSITGTWPNYGGTDQRFWVEFIDHVLGYRQTSAGGYVDISAYAGYGSDFTWGSVASSAPPGAPAEYMIYTDNPARPKLRHWFSPILMVDLFHNYNMDQNLPASYFIMQPGNSYEAPLYTAKEAYLAAVDEMLNNHPNDWFSLVPYSLPRTAATSAGRLNCVGCPLGTNYDYAKAALLFPFSTINADGSCNNTEVTPYDPDPSTAVIPSSNFMDIGRGDGSTCFAMALMQCYNQFVVTKTSDSTLRGFVTSNPITFPTGMAGGLGRKGSQKVIIFETDGLANSTATASLVNAGTYKYYQIRYDMNKPNSSEYPAVSTANINDPTVLNQVYTLVQQLATDHGTARNPFRLYALGFGPVFAAGAPDRANALTTLQTMQYYAGTQSSIATALPANQTISGTDAQMSANMISTFTSILQNGVQIALIK